MGPCPAGVCLCGGAVSLYSNTFFGVFPLKKKNFNHYYFHVFLYMILIEYPLVGYIFVLTLITTLASNVDYFVHFIFLDS